MEIFSPPPAQIPDKLYFKIGEVTAITDLAAYVLRFWESEFSAISPKRTDAGQRLYRKSDIETILMIKHLLYDKKFTIEGAKKYLKEMHRQTKEASSPPKTEEIRNTLRQIRAMLE